MSRSFIRFSVLDEISCGFAVFSDFLRGFSVSNRPLCPPLAGYIFAVFKAQTLRRLSYMILKVVISELLICGITKIKKTQNFRYRSRSGIPTSLGGFPLSRNFYVRTDVNFNWLHVRK